MALHGTSSVVEWDERFRLDIPDIDEQHEALFGMINELWRALAERHPQDALTGILGGLESYTIMHFEAEEELMRALGYPKLYAHRDAHQAFIRQIAVEKRKHLDGQPAGLALLHFLNHWLVDHIETIDREYADYYARQHKQRKWLTRMFAAPRP
jgi:hemerythrin